MGDVNRVYINTESGDVSDRPATPEQKDTSAPQPTYREGGVVHRVEIKSGTGEFTETTLRPTRGGAMDNAPADPLDRVVNVYGARVSRADIADADYVDFLGDHTPARALVAAGLLGKGADGYKWTPDGLAYLKQAGLVFKDGAPATNTQQPAVSDTNTPMNEEQAEAHIDEMIATDTDFDLSAEATAMLHDIGGKVADAPLQALVMGYAEDKAEAVASLTEEIARQAGISTEEMQAQSDKVIAEMLDRARTVTTKVGLAADEFDGFSEWLAQYPDRQREVRMAFTERNASPLVKAAKEYANSDARYTSEQWDTATIYVNGKPVAGKAVKEGGRYVVNIDGKTYPMGRVSKIESTEQ